MRLQMRLCFASSVFVAAVAFAGCSSSSSSGGSPTDGGSDGTAGVTAQTACTDAIAALCAELNKCSPFLVQLYYTDAATCASRLGTGCVDAFSTKGNGGTPDQLDACAKAVPSVACTDFLAGLNGTGLRNSLQGQTACDPVAGTLDNGAACAGDGQCKSAFCAVDKKSFCGTCAAPPAAGDACVSGACGTGLVCSTAGKCEKPGGAGDTCTDGADCNASLQCFNGKCTAKGKEGDACNADPKSTTAPDCDGAQGLGCKYDATTGKPTTCQKWTVGKAGDPCSFLDLKTCGMGSWCSGYDITKPTTPGTCSADADDGAACDDAKGPPCKGGAKCIGNICKVSAPLSCN